jgi:hypothetical protein
MKQVGSQIDTIECKVRSASGGRILIWPVTGIGSGAMRAAPNVNIARHPSGIIHCSTGLKLICLQGI